MDQLSMFEVPMKERVSKDIVKAVRKGIIPGAIVIFDNNNNYKYTVISLGIGSELKLQVLLISETGMSSESWLALSDRLTVVGYKDLSKDTNERVREYEK